MKTPSNALILGVLTALSLVGIILLPALGHQLPDVLPALGIAGVSALAGLAIPTPAPQPVPAPPPAVVVPDGGRVGVAAAGVVPGMSPVAADRAAGAP